MSRKVNRKLVVLLAALVLLLGAGGWAVYRYQTRRHARQLEVAAIEAEKEGRTDDAIAALERYLGYRPDDQQARTRLGLLLTLPSRPYASRLQGLSVLEAVLARAPDRDDLRGHLVATAMDLERWARARQHLETLLQGKPGDPDLLERLARCSEGEGTDEEAIGLYRKLLEADPARLGGYQRLARLLRGQPYRAGEADEVMDAMVARNEKSHRAWLARAAWWQERGEAAKWQEDVRQASALAPLEPEVILTEAALFQARGEQKEAVRRLREGLRHHPSSWELCHALAQLELEAGRPPVAVGLLEKALEVHPAQPDLLSLLFEALVLDQRLEEAARLAGKLPADGAPWLKDYFQARLLLASGRPLAAIRLLEKLEDQLDRVPASRRQVGMTLARCWAALGALDRQIEIYGRIIGHSPGWAPAQLALADAYLRSGRAGLAESEARTLLRLGKAPLEARLLLTRALLRQLPQATSPERLGQEIDELLDALDQAATLEAPLLRAEALVARKERDGAREVLEKARGDFPDSVLPWIALARLEVLRDSPAQALAVLEEARQKLGNRLETRLAFLEYWAGRPAEERHGPLAALEKEAASLDIPDRVRLLLALAAHYAGTGSPAEAVRLGEELAGLQPDDLRPLLVLLELALREEDAGRLRQLVGRLRRLEGDEGSYWRLAEASRLAVLAEQGDPGGLTEARQLQRLLATRRPSWPQVLLLDARLAELEGRPLVAIDSWQRALREGEADVGVIRRLARLLMEQGRWAEMDEVLQKLSRQELLAAGLGPAAAEASLRGQDLARAVEIARQAAADPSASWLAHLWLGQVLAAADRSAEAEAACRRACERAPDQPAPWVALCSLLVRTGHKDQARLLLPRAEKALTPEKALLVTARCRELLGETAEAGRQLQAGLKARPQDPTLLATLARFHLRSGQGDQAEPLLRRLLLTGSGASPEEQTWARRSLAARLAARGTFAAYRQALDLLGPDREDTSAGALLARALVLATRPGQRSEAVRLLEELRRRGGLEPPHLLLLAQLHEKAGDLAAARAVLVPLAQLGAGDARLLFPVGTALIRTGELETARAVLDRLEPGSWQVVEGRARLLAASEQLPQAVELLEQAARREGAPLPLLAAALEDLGALGPAEALYRRFTSTSDRPDRWLLLLGFLGRQRRTDDALAVLDEVWRHSPPEQAAPPSVALLFGAGEVVPGQVRRVEGKLREALAAHPDHATLRLALATLLGLDGRLEEAEALYRQVLARQPDNVLALNNLAFLLALRADRAAEAVALADRALEKTGPAPDLLDTRAAALLRLGRHQAALSEIRRALADAPSPSLYFHEAQALLQGGDVEAARAALARGRRQGLRAAALHPLERADWKPLLDGLAPE